ncbi:MAG TPA: hypothetical protein VK586_09865, partial [Streptosporangiaceae bacterium]|nr:hypothetical protein [Streptosporangiaceae bacterium]
GLPVPPPGATWLRAPRDTYLHAQAAAAAPVPEGWKTLIGHSLNGAVLDGDTLYNAAAIARRMGLHVAGKDPDGQPLAPPPDPARVLMLTCNAALQAAGALHAVTGGVHEIVSMTGEAIMVPGRPASGDDPGEPPDVIAGTWRAGAGGEPEPVANGDFLIWKDGEPQSLGTYSLREAMASRGVPLAFGDVPDEPVGFYYGLTSAQTATLDRFGYEVAAADIAAAASPDGLYAALAAAGGARLAAALGAPPTPGVLRRHLRAALEQDLASPASRYRELMAPGQDAAGVIADPQQAAEVLPHVAADTFGLDIVLLGGLGRLGSAGSWAGPRLTDPDGHSFMLVRLPDGHLAAARPRPDRPVRPVPYTSRPAGAASPWVQDLDPHTRQLIDQDAAVALAAAVHPTARGRVAEMNHLVQLMPLAQRSESDATRVRTAIRRWLTPPEAAGEPGPLSPEAREEHLDWLEGLERHFAAAAAAAATRGAELRDEYLRAVQEAGPPPDDAGRAAAEQAAQDAALVRMMGELGHTFRAARDAPAPHPPGGIRDALSRAYAAAERAAQAARTAAADPAQAARDSVEASLADPDLEDRITELADVLPQVRYGPDFERWLADAQVAATDAVAAAQEDLRPRLDAQREARTWQLRRNVAVEELARSAPERELPPGFGVVFGGRARFPMGHQGRFVRLGDVPVSREHYRELGELVARSLPANVRDLL